MGTRTCPVCNEHTWAEEFGTVAVVKLQARDEPPGGDTPRSGWGEEKPFEVFVRICRNDDCRYIGFFFPRQPPPKPIKRKARP